MPLACSEMSISFCRIGLSLKCLKFHHGCDDLGRPPSHPSGYPHESSHATLPVGLLGRCKDHAFKTSRFYAGFWNGTWGFASIYPRRVWGKGHGDGRGDTAGTNVIGVHHLSARGGFPSGSRRPWSSRGPRVRVLEELDGVRREDSPSRVNGDRRAAVCRENHVALDDIRSHAGYNSLLDTRRLDGSKWRWPEGSGLSYYSRSCSIEPRPRSSLCDSPA